GVNGAGADGRAGGGGRAGAGGALGRLPASAGPARQGVPAEVVHQGEAALRLAHSVGARLEDNYADLLRPAVADMGAQLSGLIYPGFVAATGYRRLPHLTRYLRGIERRLGKLPDNPAPDAPHMPL